MFATLDHLENTATSILLLNVGKFFFRLTSPLRYSFFKLLRINNYCNKRDSVVQRIVEKDPASFNSVESNLRKKYIVASGIQTEIILENSCAIFAGVTMYAFIINNN